MHFRGSAALWGPSPKLGPVLPFKPVSHLHTIFFFCLIPPLPPHFFPFCPLFTVIWPSTDPGYDSCPAAQILEPGPALIRRAIWALGRERQTDRNIFCSAVDSQLFITSVSSQRLQTDIKLGSGRTSVGVGRGWSLQMRGGVRWWIKAARCRRGWRQHAGVGGGRLGRNRLGRGVRGREKIRFKLKQRRKKCDCSVHIDQKLRGGMFSVLPKGGARVVLWKEKWSQRQLLNALCFNHYI